jgi:LmbE family N-acetylglucosaminyl deacetylase
MSKKGPVLVVAAHPDDEVLGCGGTIAGLAQHGYRVDIGILGEGVTSRYESREKAPVDETAQIREQAHRAARLLGAGDLRMFQLPDNRFDTVPLIEIIKLVNGLLEDLQPDLILTHHGGDLNVDHRRTFQAVLTACRPQPGFHHPDLYSFYVPSSTEWGDGAILPPFIPDTYVDVEKTLDLKVQALSCYPSEVRDSPHPRSLEGIRITARYWGNRAGLQAAEPFSLVRRIWKIDHE